MAKASQVLVIDDDSFMRTFCKTILEAAGYEVLLAEDAESGEKMASSPSVDLIILDYAMPRTTGLELLERLSNATTRRVPVIVLSAWDSPAVRRQAEGLGASWINKPLSSAGLTQAVNRTIGPALVAM